MLRDRNDSAVPDAPGRIVNAMTIDVEDYFQASVFDPVVSRDAWGRADSRVCRNTERLLTIFDEVGVQATFFALGWVAEKFPALMRTIVSRGHELASHSYEHRLVYEMSPDEFRQDLRRAKRALEDAAGVPVYGFRAPSYSITGRSMWALDILLEEGFRYDASIFPVWHDRYGIPTAPRHAHVMQLARGRLVEAPPSTVRWCGMNLPVGGGGYTRQLPYAWTAWGMTHIHAREQLPAIFYLHPWEIDPEQPRIDLPLLARVRHYRNLHKTESRLRRLVREYRFAPLATVLDAHLNECRPSSVSELSTPELACVPALSPETSPDSAGLDDRPRR